MAKQMSTLPGVKAVRANPSAAELDEMVASMPNARHTRYGNLNVQTRVLARSKARPSSSATTRRSAPSRGSRERRATESRRSRTTSSRVGTCSWSTGYIGDAPYFHTPARLYIEEANANIAAMQKQLFFDVDGDGGSSLS